MMDGESVACYGVAAVEGIGYAALGFFGAEALFAPADLELSLWVTLGPALAAGFGVAGYRFAEMTSDRAGQDEMLGPAQEDQDPDQPAPDPEADEMASNHDEGNWKPNHPPAGGLRPSTPG